MKQKQKTPPEFSVGQLVYIPDEELVWRQGLIHSVKGDNCVVKLGPNQNDTQMSTVAQADTLQACDTDLLAIQDLTNLSPLNPATVLDTLECRYHGGQYYTATGSTVLAVNPFRQVSQLYDVTTIYKYSSGQADPQELPPHVYSTGEKAFSKLASGTGERNQTIIVSGESGAGKTVTAKHLLKYLALRAHPHDQQLSLCYSSVENKILESNPILEAFGNAATPRNDNSSRFGKYIQLQFSRSMAVVGASINTYLLEKTRVAHQANTDCNFHIFYQVVGAITCGCLHLPALPDVQMTGTEFRILPHLSHNSDTDRPCAAEWRHTQAAMDDLGLSRFLQQALVEMLVSVLYLGNVVFVEEEDTCDLCHSPECLEAITTSAKLLGLEPEALERAFLFRNIQSASTKRRSVYVKPLNKTEAESRRDCLLMLLYFRLFDWLVGFINSKITSGHYNSCIGLLDIYGFEGFEDNSLEQLCINYANERLQQHYIQHFLRDVQLEYEKEGLRWEHTEFRDNLPTVELLDGKSSVFGVLNEEVCLNRESDSVAVQGRIAALSQTPHRSNPQRKVQADGRFTIRHYAGEVSYSVENMVEKNRDNIPPEFSALLQASTVPYVSSLFVTTDPVSSGAGAGRRTCKRKTVLVKFKTSLDELMSEVNHSDVQYVRCVKPNRSSAPCLFDRRYVMDQLAASGVLETVEVCRKGHAVRMCYQSFLRRYSPLLRHCNSPPNHAENKENDPRDNPEGRLRGGRDPSLTPRTPVTPRRRRRVNGDICENHSRKICSAILTTVLDEQHSRDYLLGLTKVFLKEYQWEELEATRLRCLSSHVVIIQKSWRACCSRRKLRLQIRVRQKAASRIQRAVRRWLEKLRHQSRLSAQTLTEEATKSPKRRRVSVSPLGRMSVSPLGGLVCPEDQSHTTRTLPDDQPCYKKRRVNQSCLPLTQPLSELVHGNGIVSRRRLPRVPIRFHTRASVLSNAHLIHRKEYQCSLTDCLPDPTEPGASGSYHTVISNQYQCSLTDCLPDPTEPGASGS